MKKYNAISSAYFVNLACLPFAVISVLMNSNGDYNVAVSLITLAMGLLCIHRVRKHWYLFFIFMFIFWCNWSVLVNMYIFRDLTNYRYGASPHNPTAVLGLNILCLFSLMLLAVTPEVKSCPPAKSITENNRDNPLIVIMLIILLCFILVFGFKARTASETRELPSSWFEYSTVFILLGFYYSGKRVTLKYILLAISALYMLKALTSGERIAALQLIIVIMFSLYVEKLRMKVLIPLGVITIVLMTLIGNSRANTTISLETLEPVIEFLKKSKFALNTAYGGYDSAMTIVESLSFTEWETRLYYLAMFLLSLIAGHYFIKDNIVHYARQYIHNHGGCFMPYHGYFFLGFSGVLLTIIYLHFILRVVRDSVSSDDGCKRCIAIYITAQVLRWYLYSISHITRTLLAFLLAYYVLDFIDRSTKRHARIIHAGNM